jgi:hypothetical protein
MRYYLSGKALGIVVVVEDSMDGRSLVLARDKKHGVPGREQDPRQQGNAPLRGNGHVDCGGDTFAIFDQRLPWKQAGCMALSTHALLHDIEMRHSSFLEREEARISSV